MLQIRVSDFMKNILPLSQDKKLTVVVRVESGCLGPNGGDHVEEFCSVAQVALEPTDSDFINWEVFARMDKALPEIQYKTNNKILTQEQATKYLTLFNKNIDEFEESLNEKLAIPIDQHLDY